MLEIRVVSEPARLSYRLQLQIAKNQPGRIATVVPPTPTAPPEPTRTPIPSPTPTPAAPSRPGRGLGPGLAGWSIFGWSALAILGVSGLSFRLGRRRDLDRAWRAALLGFIAGWSAYSLLLFGSTTLPIPELPRILPLTAGATALLIGGLAALIPSGER
jgi:hypothetical protein